MRDDEDTRPERAVDDSTELMAAATRSDSAEEWTLDEITMELPRPAQPPRLPLRLVLAAFVLASLLSMAGTLALMSRL